MVDRVNTRRFVMENYKISVIIPMYNVEKQIP